MAGGLFDILSNLSSFWYEVACYCCILNSKMWSIEYHHRIISQSLFQKGKDLRAFEPILQLRCPGICSCSKDFFPQLSLQIFVQSQIQHSPLHCGGCSVSSSNKQIDGCSQQLKMALMTMKSAGRVSCILLGLEIRFVICFQTHFSFHDLPAL